MNPETMYTHCDGDSGRATVRMSGRAAADCSHSGACDDDVAHWIGRVEWLATDDELRRNLKRYGAWDDLAEVDTDTLRSRALWLAAGDIREQPDMYI